jgi:protoporphyrinogen oxidase
MKTNKDESIAIIGAGVSGILTAIELQRLGYKNITLYEKASRIATTTTTLTHDGNIFDITTKLISSIHLLHNSIYPPLKELIDKTGVTLVVDDFPKTYFYDLEKKKDMGLPYELKQFSKIKLVKDFAKGYELLLAISRVDSLQELFKTDLIKEEENLIEWAERHQVQAFGVAINYLIDQFNMGPSYNMSAGIYLLSRTHAMAPLLHSILSKNGVKHFYNLFGKKYSPEFKRFINFKRKASNFNYIKEGYEEFLGRLVEKFNLKVQLNSNVTDLKREASGLTFKINGGEEVRCDNIIFCCPPVAVADITYHPKVKELMRGVKPERTIRAWVFEASNWDEKTFGKTGHVIDGSNRMGLTTKDMKINGELMYVFKEFSNSDLIVSLVYYDKHTEAELEEAFKTSLKRFDLKLEKVITHRDFIWPIHPSVELNKAGWVGAMEDLQGVDNMYYSGEAFCGVGVAPIMQNTGKFLKRHFN